MSDTEEKYLIMERELEKTEEKKPEEITGWVAWHEDEGFIGGTFAETEDEVQLHVDESYYKAPDGWRIRPVKVVFTDKETEE